MATQSTTSLVAAGPPRLTDMAIVRRLRELARLIDLVVRPLKPDDDLSFLDPEEPGIQVLKASS